MSKKVLLRELAGAYAVAQLDPAGAIPDWADGEGFVSISRSAQELSIVCLAARVPAPVRQDAPWTCFQLPGPFAFGETGVVLAVIRPLSEAGLGVFVVSTFDGDHVLVKSDDAPRARELLAAAGHTLALS
jgi:uncharacterized protein